MGTIRDFPAEWSPPEWDQSPARRKVKRGGHHQQAMRHELNLVSCAPACTWCNAMKRFVFRYESL